MVDDTYTGGQANLQSEGFIYHASSDDLRVVGALLDDDEAAFTSLLEQYQRPMLRLAMAFVRNRAVAEEVVQETWEGVMKGLSRFRGDPRSKLGSFES